MDYRYMNPDYFKIDIYPLQDLLDDESPTLVSAKNSLDKKEIIQH